MSKRNIDAYFERIDRLGWDPGLRSVKELLRRLGNPQDDMPVVHIAGTNGKGSTLAYLSSILQESGLIVGRFTSPELLRRNEMISINGQEISDEEMETRLQQIETASVEMMKDGFRHPTTFEVMAAMAFLCFSSHADIALIETGMGGRLDATNVVKHPILCLISPIGLDHLAFLGDSIAAIAKEKAGIFRSFVPIVSAPQELAAKAVLQSEAQELQSDLKWIDDALLSIEEERERLQFSYAGQSYQTKMLGRHQAVNAAVAIEAARLLGKLGWKVTESAIRDGVSNAHWAGRFEILRSSPLLIIDGAHNAQGMKALNAARKQVFHMPFQAVVGVLGEKEMGTEFLEILKDADEVWTATPNSPRALPADKLSERLKALGIPSKPMPDLSSLAESIYGLRKPCLVFGSLYLIGAVRAELKERLNDDSSIDC